MIIDENTIDKNFKGNIFETAAELRVSLQTVMASLKKYGIYFEKPKHIYSDLKKTDFSEFQKGLLIGSILGDGHLEKRSHLRNALFREEHAMDQVGWLKWKYNNLKPFITSDMWSRDRGNKVLMPDGEGGKKMYNIQSVCSMSTNIHPYLTELHNLFYRDRKKVIPCDFIKSMFNELIFSVWLGDDGYYNWKRNYVVLCTESFSFEDIKVLECCLNSLGIKNTVIIKHSKNPINYRLYINNFSSNKQLINVCLDILPTCMHYKVTPVFNEHQVATH